MRIVRNAVLALEIVAVYARVRVMLVRGDLPGVVAALRAGRAPTRTARSDRETHQAATRMARAVRRTLALLPSDTRCLMQSLVLTRMLATRGIGSSVVIGVSPGPEFAAHAWVESDDLALLPRLEGRFSRLAAI